MPSRLLPEAGPDGGLPRQNVQPAEWPVVVEFDRHLYRQHYVG
ncbi:hypothetical protein [Longibacter salinarum]|nr:hypothetical protein [Longibacter salinarum]